MLEPYQEAGESFRKSIDDKYENHGFVPSVTSPTTYKNCDNASGSNRDLKWKCSRTHFDVHACRMLHSVTSTQGEYRLECLDDTLLDIFDLAGYVKARSQPMPASAK